MYVCHLTFTVGPAKWGGHNSDMWSFSVTFFTAIIFVVNTRLFVSSRSIYIINMVIVLFTSIFLYIAYGWVSNFLWYSKTY